MTVCPIAFRTTSQVLTGFRKLEKNARHWLRVVAEEWGLIVMRRLGVIVALGALLGMLGGLLTASPALAGRGPKWQFGPAKPITLPASFCGFKVRLTPVVNKEFTKVLKTADGSMTFLFTGSFKATATNLSTGKTILQNASGPGKIITHPDGSVTVREQGHSPLILAPADAKRFGLPTVSILAGGLTLSVDSAGNLTSLSLRGHVLMNVCAALS